MGIGNTFWNTDPTTLKALAQKLGSGRLADYKLKFKSQASSQELDRSKSVPRG
jgi:hypothetical protein